MSGFPQAIEQLSGTFDPSLTTTPQVRDNSAAGSHELQYWSDRAACIDPRAAIMYAGTGQSVTVPANETWYSLNQWYQGTAAAGYTFQRVADASRALAVPAGTTLVTDAAQAGYFYLIRPALVNALRTDSCGVTSGSSTITDTSITVNDFGKPVSGQGIPAGSYVGWTLTAGTSFTLVDKNNNAVNATATGTFNLTLGDSRYQTDPRGLYFTRLSTLRTLTRNVTMNAITAGSARGTVVGHNLFAGGGHHLCLALLSSGMDVSWNVLETDGNQGINLNVEISDDHQTRFTDVIMFPFRQGFLAAADAASVDEFNTRCASVTGNATDTSLAGWGSLTWVTPDFTW